MPYWYAVFAIGNFLGPLTLGRLFDTVGRKPMVSFCYLGSAAMLVLTAALFQADALAIGSFMALICVTFFIASAGASSAYLTVSEIFPMETRALSIAFFYAVGTAVGGITGPLLFGHLIASGELGQVAFGLYLGAAVMAIGGVALITSIVFIYLHTRPEEQPVQGPGRNPKGEFIPTSWMPVPSRPLAATPAGDHPFASTSLSSGMAY